MMTNCQLVLLPLSKKLIIANCVQMYGDDSGFSITHGLSFSSYLHKRHYQLLVTLCVCAQNVFLTAIIKAWIHLCCSSLFPIMPIWFT
uniref:Putative ovule protein n=1 Tax=Solanum chacoense TaxID=4108 RepID=A0A0V0GV92_SOLCH